MDVDWAFQILRRRLGGDDVARSDLESAINLKKVRLLWRDGSVPGWELDPPQTLSVDATRSTRLLLDEGHAIILTRDPSGHTGECILDGETWYYNGNFFFEIPDEDLVARWSIFAHALDRAMDERGLKAVAEPPAAAGTKPRLNEDKHPRDAVVHLLDACAANGIKLPINRKARLEEINKLLPQKVSLSTLRRAEKLRETRPSLA